MDYRTLTGTGATVSRICLGTMTFGSQVNETDAINMTHYAIDAGINFIDTADMYNDGESERIVGKALKGKRDGIVLASKVRNQVGPYELKDVGLSRWHVIKGVEACLKRLDTDCLDICYLHQPDYNTPLEESLAAFDKLVKDGKVIYVGMSNYAAWQMCQAMWICDKRLLSPPVVTQVPYNLITRSIEQELIPFCREMDMGITVYNPLSAGLLTGKHSGEKPPADNTRFSLSDMYYERYWYDTNFEAVKELEEIAKKAGKSIIELAFQWIVSHEFVDSMIIGFSKMEHLKSNLAAWEGEVDQETLDACDQVWEKIRGVSFKYNR
ncbi:aldo/keto reductase [Candidatus Poribacteria bacterium]|nr:aldo/keto reductase [Candidatus Poribacteria bacterium]